MRGNNKKQLIREQRKELEDKRSEVSKERKNQRRLKGKAEELAKAIQHTPAGKKAAETRKTKRGITRKQEQANYQKTRSRAATRMGGKTKQLRAEQQKELEE